jgi:hypothetical protein
MTNPQQAAAYLDEITRLNAEIERLRAVMKTAIRQFEDGNLLSCHRTLCDRVRSDVYNAIDALAQE